MFRGLGEAQLEHSWKVSMPLDPSASRDRPILDGPLMVWPEPLWERTGLTLPQVLTTLATHLACIVPEATRELSPIAHS